MRQPCLHVGIVKTGTSSLQLSFFAKHPEILFLGLYGHRYEDERLEELSQSIRRYAPSNYDSAATKELFSQSVSPYLSGNAVVVLSDERLTSRTFRENAYIEWIRDVDQEMVARRLSELFVGWKVLITIRAQDKLLWSWYLHDCRNVIVSPGKWFDEHFGRGDAGRLGALKFFELSELYRRHFGSENVAVFPFEALISNEAEFLHRLCLFLGINAKGFNTGGRITLENVRLSRRMMAYQRLRRYLMPSTDLHRWLPAPVKRIGYQFLRRGLPTVEAMPATWETPIKNYFRTSNQKLVARDGLPLAEYNYPL